MSITQGKKQTKHKKNLIYLYLSKACFDFVKKLRLFQKNNNNSSVYLATPTTTALIC